MPPVSVMVKPVSGLCNMRCTYCFYADEMQNRETPLLPRMSEETLEYLIRRIFSYGDSSISLAFQGGEPTLAGTTFYTRLLELENQYNTRRIPVRHSMQTNGLYLSDSLLSVLKAGDFLVGVSLDGIKTIHDARRQDATGQPTWDRVTANLRRLREAEIPYNILCVVDRWVAEKPEEVFTNLREHGYLQFIPHLDGLNGIPDADSLTAEAYGNFLIRTFRLYEKSFWEKKFVSVRTFDNWLNMLCGHPPESCGLSGRCSISFLVEGDGSVYPCDFYALDHWRMGNLRTDSFFRMEKSTAAREFIASSLPMDAACNACEWSFLCHGGCRREREPFTDGIPRLNRLCEGLKAFFSACYPRMKELSRRPPPPMPN
ncbi:MAG: radical SAM protein [Christensenellales bacterium]|jgi:uncharacterized protein